MNRPFDPMFDDRIADWLEDDPAAAPALLLETVIAAVPSIPQRAARARWLPAGPWSSFRFAFVAAIVAALGLVWLYLPRTPSVGPPTSPTPAVEPSFGISGATVPFTSPRYGYSIQIPAEWSVRAATAQLGELEPPWIDSAAVDYIAANPAGTLTPGVIVSAAELSPGRTLADWTRLTTEAMCGAGRLPRSVSVGDEEGRMLEYDQCNGVRHLWVTAVHGTIGYHIVWLGYLGQGSQAADRALLESILASFQFPTATGSTTGPS